MEQGSQVGGRFEVPMYELRPLLSAWCYAEGGLTMQKRFTAMVPQPVLTKLGWSNPATWAEVFDHLADKGMLISISRWYNVNEFRFEEGYDWAIDCEETLCMGECGYASSWERAAEAAVVNCLEMLS